MKDSAAVRQKLKQVLTRHLQKQLKDVFRRRPRTCLHNRAFDLGRPGDEVGMCFYMLDNKPRGVPCDERVKGHGVEQAKCCPYWEPLRGKEDVQAEFHSILDTKNLAIIAGEYPDVAALMWVLGDDADMGELDDVVGDTE